MPSNKASPKGSYYKPKRNFEKSVKKIVQEELSEELEQKIAIVEYPNQVPSRAIPSGNIGITAQQNIFKLLPPIPQSTTGEAGAKYNMRIGNQINLREISLDGFLSYRYPLTDSAVAYPDAKLAVRVMIVRAKQYNDLSKAFTDMPTNVLIRNGSSLSNHVGPYGGYTMDSFREINRDAFAVRYDKVFYLNAPVEIPGGATLSSDFGVIPSGLKLFKHKIKFGQNGMKLTFSNQTDDEAENFPLMLLVGYSSMSGTSRPNDNLVDMSFTCQATYTDA